MLEKCTVCSALCKYGKKDIGYYWNGHTICALSVYSTNCLNQNPKSYLLLRHIGLLSLIDHTDWSIRLTEKASPLGLNLLLHSRVHLYCKPFPARKKMTNLQLVISWDSMNYFAPRIMKWQQFKCKHSVPPRERTQVYLNNCWNESGFASSIVNFM